MSDDDYYETFNTKVDVGLVVELEHTHPVLLKYIAAKNEKVGRTPYDQLSADEMKNSEKRHKRHSYVLRNSGPQHKDLKESMHNAFVKDLDE